MLIYGNQDVVVDIHDVKKLYVTKLPYEDLASTSTWLYCIDVDWKEKGSCTISIYTDRETAVAALKSLCEELPGVVYYMK